MIQGGEPKTWHELQETVAQILRESGVQASVDESISLARGTVNVDVFAFDSKGTPNQTYIIECKHWKNRVPKEKVHSFRTVIGDSGANWGAIVSSKGFQRGAVEAAKYSNVRLLTWDEFQELFAAEWYDRYFLPAIHEAGDPLIEYTEPINSRIFKKADKLPDHKRERFKELRRRYHGLGSYCLVESADHLGVLRMFLKAKGVSHTEPRAPSLPLRDGFDDLPDLPDQILDACSLRELLRVTKEQIDHALNEFDAVFGERA